MLASGEGKKEALQASLEPPATRPGRAFCKVDPTRRFSRTSFWRRFPAWTPSPRIRLRQRTQRDRDYPRIAPAQRAQSGELAWCWRPDDHGDCLHCDRDISDALKIGAVEVVAKMLIYYFHQSALGHRFHWAPCANEQSQKKLILMVAKKYFCWGVLVCVGFFWPRPSRIFWLLSPTTKGRIPLGLS